MFLAIKVLVGIFICLVFMYASAFKKNKLPMTSSPGFWKRFNIYMATHIAETKENHEFAELELQGFGKSSDELFITVEKSIASLGWKIERSDKEKKELHILIQTKLFKFTDDMYITIKEVRKNMSALHIKSSSRIGIGDLGTNTRHILDLQDKVKKLI